MTGPVGLLSRVSGASARHPFRTLAAWVVVLGTAGTPVAQL